jgi:hypothetical protein
VHAMHEEVKGREVGKKGGGEKEFC